jgi:hypothetical protein
MRKNIKSHSKNHSRWLLYEFPGDFLLTIRQRKRIEKKNDGLSDFLSHSMTSGIIYRSWARHNTRHTQRFLECPGAIERTPLPPKESVPPCDRTVQQTIEWKIPHWEGNIVSSLLALRLSHVKVPLSRASPDATPLSLSLYSDSRKTTICVRVPLCLTGCTPHPPSLYVYIENNQKAELNGNEPDNLKGKSIDSLFYFFHTFTFLFFRAQSHLDEPYAYTCISSLCNECAHSLHQTHLDWIESSTMNGWHSWQMCCPLLSISLD